ncbi:uncharacterized protein [Anas platyrhynchos]|uniref:uncharacterized protein isoform X2 n=1 Tax=Anas platyrhynchos TaxID=8839 RepID=UPI003AF1E415
MFNLCSLGPRGQKLRSAELRCGGLEETTKHQHWGAPALSHPQPQGTGARSRARGTSPDAFDISRMAGEEDEALSFPTEDDGDGQDASLSVGPSRDTSPWVTRRESLESLGVRISRLSQIIAGKPWGEPCLAPSEEDTGHPWRPPGSSASRSGAGSRGHPRRKPTETRHQQPAATWGWQGGDTALAVEKTGGGSKQRGAHRSSHRTEAAAGPSGRCSPHSKVLSFVSCPVQPQGQRGRLAAVLSHKLVSLRRALRRSQEGTQELGAGARGTWREGERGRGSQRGRDGGTGQARRATSALRDEKLELQERLRELQHRTRSLLRQRLETLEQLRVLLREEEATASHQLQEAVEKRWSRRPRLRSATSPSPSTSPGLRQHGPGSPRLLHHVQRCLQELQVDKTPHGQPGAPRSPGRRAGHRSKRGGMGTAWDKGLAPRHSLTQAQEVPGSRHPTPQQEETRLQESSSAVTGTWTGAGRC